MAKKKSDAKDAALYVRMTRPERAQVNADAQSEGLPTATYVRKTLLRKKQPGRGLAGAWEEGPGSRARLVTGLRMDKPRAGSLKRRRGTVLKAKTATEEIMRIRVEQVGPKTASATVTRCEGVWRGGGSEPTLQCEIAHVPTPRELQTETFHENMIDLAERAAERFGQEETWLWIDETLIRATAPGEPAPKGLRKGGKRRR